MTSKPVSRVESASICRKCENKLLPWSEFLRSKYNGCNMLLRHDIPEHMLSSVIQAKEIALGWVTNGQGRAFNFQVLTKCVVKCQYYQPKNNDKKHTEGD